MELKTLLLKQIDEQNKLKDAMAIVDQINSNLAVIENDITDIITDPVKLVREQTAKTTGTVDVLVQGVMVKHSVPKSVKWDQTKLTSIRAKIAAHDDNPDNYMESKTTHKVSEKAYKKMSPEIKAVFDKARTVTGGKAKVSFDTNWR